MKTGLPEWGTAELPEPLPYTPRNVVRTVGPGAILLAGSIGGGEWMVGPALAVQHGPGLFWIATVAIVLQTLFNLEAIRYTLYTGEPAVVGIMRLKPGSRFWGGVYSILTVAQLGLPALAAACSAVIFAAFLGRMPGAPDAGALQWVTYGVIVLTAVVLASGRTVERMLEMASWAMIAFIFVFLAVINVVFVGWSNWVRTAAGFFEFGHIPADADAVLLATLAATAGSGGIGNLVVSSWARDKGFGMGRVAGAIPSAIGGRSITLSPVGKVFPVNSGNLRRWRVWWKHVVADQVWLWGLGCFVGMFLNVNLATGLIPRGTDLAGLGAGAFQAEYLARHAWAGFWFLALLNGFWILFSTHLANTDALVRTVTDIVWVSRGGERKPGHGVARVYYTLLVVFTAWSAVAANWGSAITLFKALGLVAGPILALASIQLLRVNTRLLPAELRPPVWRRAALVACAGFYVAMLVVAARG